MHRTIHVFTLFSMSVEAKHTSKGNRDLTCHSAAEPDCSDYEVASWSSGGEMQQQQADFICVVPARLLANRKAAGIFPLLPFKHGIHGHHFRACLMCSAVWNGCSLQCQHTVKSPHPSHLDAFFTEMFAWAETRHLSPWGAPNVTNQMWTEKCISTMKTTWTQLVVALNKNVDPATKPIV